MTLTATSLRERRKFPRHEPPPRFDASLLLPQGAVPAHSINVSEGGLCVRLEETLEVRSLVRLQLTPVEGSGSGRGQRPMECAGRVAWVIQRLDLRSAPPFLFDVGVEFVDPPPLLRP
ncbi:MAG: PilZ domain-containing protein, partial [Candidatus Omnitrophica bacterium]|nr:PilZ domain-containing protein [Candidatus Omnitrophota bacterium]